MRRRMAMLGLAVGVLALSGCLFSVNHPMVAPDGTLTLFLDEHGGYALFPEAGTLHLLRDEAWVPVPAAVLADAGGPLDLSPDGSELLYVDVRSGGFLEPPTTALLRVALRTDAVPELVWETDSAIVTAEWTTGTQILVLEIDGDGLGRLVRLDNETGETEPLRENVLATLAIPDRPERLVMVQDRDESPETAVVELWDPTTGRSERLASFVLHAQTAETFAILPPNFLWDVSPDGRWLALALYDSALLEPEVETELPNLYLLDLEAGEAERVAVDALLPAFSPSGEGFTFMQAAEDGSGAVMWRGIRAERSIAVPGGEGASTAFWLSADRLGLTFPVGEEFVCLVALDVDSGEMRELVGAPEE